MKTTLITILLLFLSAQVDAKPRHRVADWKFWVAAAANLGTSVAATATIARCKHDHGPDQCVGGGYAPMPPTEIIRGTTSGMMIPLSYFWKQQEELNGQKHKFWWLYDVGPIAFNTTVMVRNARRTFGPKDLN